MRDHLIRYAASIAPYTIRIHAHRAVETPKLLSGGRSRWRFA
jgi:hypothetical protein